MSRSVRFGFADARPDDSPSKSCRTFVESEGMAGNAAASIWEADRLFRSIWLAIPPSHNAGLV
jgi:hypothetical protein